MRISAAMCIVAIGVLLAGRAAMAGTVSATFNTVSPYSSVDISLNSGTNWTTERAGQMDWTRTGGSYTGLGGANSSGFQFTSFCVELTQNVSYNTVVPDYTIVGVDQVPSPGGSGVGVGMGSNKSLELRELWGMFHDGIQPDDAVGAAAFQLAVWEIVYDSDTSLSTGSFRARNRYSGDPVPGMAQSWLNQLNGTHAMATLYGLSSPSAQDQVFAEEPVALPADVSVVPLPSAVWAGAVLLIGLIIRRIRRHRNAKA